MLKPRTLAVVIAALVAATLPSGMAAGDEAEAPDVTVTSTPSPVPSATGGTPAPDDDGAPDDDESDGASRLDVEERTSVSQLRHLGITVSGEHLPPGLTASLRLDGSAVRDVTTASDGTVEGVRVRFPGIAAGDHVLSLVADGETLASLDLEVGEDLFEVTATPRWVSAATLRTSGVRLRVGAEHRSVTMDQDFDAFVVHRSADGAVDEVPVGSGSTRDDGTVDVTVTGDADDFPGGPGTVHSVCLRADFLRFLFSCTDLRVTALTIGQSDDGRTVTGTGFEPGSTVDLVVDGTRVSGATAKEDSSVRLPLEVLALRTVALRSSAGEASLDVPPLPAKVQTLAASLKERAALVATIQETRGVLTAATGPGSEGRSFTRTESDAMRQQILAQEKLFGAFPSSPSRLGTTVPDVTQTRPAFDHVCAILGACPSVPAVDPGSRIGVGLTSLEEQRRKDRQAAIDEAKAQSDAMLDQLDDLRDQQLEALKTVVSSILGVINEMQAGRLDSMRAITRASTPTVVARQVVGAGDVLSVDVPTTFRGRHHVVVIDPATGFVTAVQPFDAVEADDEVAAGEDTGAPLPDTGAEVARGLLPVGVALLLLGAAFTALGRRRRV